VIIVIKLGFYGAAANVTGSQYFIEADGSRILVDCGMYQERDFKYRNWAAFHFSPETIDAVLLTHAHVDHCGLIPKLVKEGFRGKIYCTGATSEIAQIILLDAAHLQEEDAEFKRRRHEREGRRGPFPEVPLYTTEDAESSFSLFSPVEYDEILEIGKGIKVTFHDAGHVLGSAMIQVDITKNGEERNILFSGDVGRWDRPILEDPTFFKETDYLVVESTYGNRVHDAVPDIGESLAEIINSTFQAGGNIIVPSFALQRSQEILYYLNELLEEGRIPSIPVFLDSPMAVKITEVFKRNSELFDKQMTELLRHKKSPFDFPGLKLVQNVDESKAIKDVSGTAMIIAGSGMCNGGRIKYHLEENIKRPQSTILFVGYQAIGTLGRQIVDGAKKVRILGKKHQVRARIAQIYGFSAHADRDELLKWVSRIKHAPKQIFVVHGEDEAAQQFSDFIKEKTEWQVLVPQYGEEVILE